MRHGIGYKKLNKKTSHRNAMLANLALSLAIHEQIETTLPKAKELRRYFEKLVTIAKKSDLAARRRLISILRQSVIAEKMISVIALRYKSRNGGYTRIVKTGFRYGDMAPTAIIELLDRDVESKGSTIASIEEKFKSDLQKSKK